MKKDYIDNFFDNISDDVLKEKWEKYNKFSKNENSVKVSELLESWKYFYESTFSFEETKIEPEIKSNVNIEKSEQCFGLFFYI